MSHVLDQGCYEATLEILRVAASRFSHLISAPLEHGPNTSKMRKSEFQSKAALLFVRPVPALITARLKGIDDSPIRPTMLWTAQWEGLLILPPKPSELRMSWWYLPSKIPHYLSFNPKSPPASVTAHNLNTTKHTTPGYRAPPRTHLLLAPLAPFLVDLLTCTQFPTFCEETDQSPLCTYMMVKDILPSVVIWCLARAPSENRWGTKQLRTNERKKRKRWRLCSFVNTNPQASNLRKVRCLNKTQATS